MVENVGFNRVPTREEAQDYKQIGQKSVKMVFLEKLSKIHAEHTKNHKPFDAQCAKLDFTDKIEAMEKESERQHGYIKNKNANEVNFGDLSKYGDLKRFDIVEDDEEIEMQNVNNTKTAIIVGHTIKYVCKERGHGCSVFVPIELYNERFEKKKSKKDIREE